MIAIGPNHSPDFHDDRYSELRERESLRLKSMRKQYKEDIREAFLKSLQPQPVRPEYVDYLGEFGEEKNPFNTVLNALYSEVI